MRFFSSAVGIGPSVAAMMAGTLRAGQTVISESGPLIKYASATRDLVT
jgi:hypothetical protein